MKKSKSRDVWRALEKRPYPRTLENLSVSNLKGFADSKIVFQKGITAICGGNGAGKTTLITALYCLLASNHESFSSFLMERLNGATISAVINCTEHGEILKELEDRLPTDRSTQQELDVIHLDMAKQCLDTIKLFSSIANLDEMLAGVEEYIFDNKAISSISYIAGKTYSAVSAFELDMGEEDEYLPYFRVTCGDVTYGSESMGLGELAAHCILWNLNRLTPKSIVLIEEPETYLAPSSQVALINSIAQLSVTKDLCIILSTHSPSIINLLPMNSIKFISRPSEQAFVIDSVHTSEYLDALGLRVSKQGILLVEDEVAKEFACNWINHFAPHILKEYQIVIATGGESRITQALSFPQVGDWLKIIGLYDGDQRNPPPQNSEWSFSFLPENVAPEIFLRNAATCTPMKLAEFIGIQNKGRLLLALDSLNGCDHHDWLLQLSEKLGISLSYTISALFRNWLNDPQNYPKAKQSIDELLSAIR